MMASWQPSRAAQRRRWRRLRALPRHGRQSIAMALAAALHHTPPLCWSEEEKCGVAAGRRSTGTEHRHQGQEVEHEQYHAPREQKPPPPGERPGLLAELGPQKSDRTAQRSSGVTPLVVVPSLAGGDGIDSTTISFLVRVALKQKEEKEKEEREKAKKAKRTLRRFSGWVFALPDAHGRCGFIESDEARAALALVQDLPFSAYPGSFGLYEPVTFAVRRGPAGLEAVDLVAQRQEVRRLASPHPILGAIRLKIWRLFYEPLSDSSCLVSVFRLRSTEFGFVWEVTCGYSFPI